jgi:hypothetical protein
MPRITPPACAACSRGCTRHAEHFLHRIYARVDNYTPIGWECRECLRFWRDPLDAHPPGVYGPLAQK